MEMGHILSRCEAAASAGWRLGLSLGAWRALASGGLSPKSPAGDAGRGGVSAAAWPRFRSQRVGAAFAASDDRRRTRIPRAVSRGVEFGAWISRRAICGVATRWTPLWPSPAASGASFEPRGGITLQSSLRAEDHQASRVDGAPPSLTISAPRSVSWTGARGPSAGSEATTRPASQRDQFTGTMGGVGPSQTASPFLHSVAAPLGCVRALSPALGRPVIAAVTAARLDGQLVCRREISR